MAARPRERPRPQAPFRDSCPVTTLGPDVWVGQGAFLKAGVTVGAGAIIGARAHRAEGRAALRHHGRDPRPRAAPALPGGDVERLLARNGGAISLYDLFDAPFDDVDRALDVDRGT
jgi:hypothetical protein